MKAIKYYFIEFLNRGIRAQIGLFGALTLFFIIIFALLEVLLTSNASIVDSLWNVTTWMLDPGTYAGNIGLKDRLISFASTLVGILLMSSLIGLISASLMDFILQIRKGVGNIEEDNYTLIIGWNFRVYKLVQEIIRANLNVASHSIVILSSKDKISMDQEIELNIKIPKKIKVITRSMDLLMLNSYSIIDLNKAKSIILLNDSSANNDISMLKLLLMMDKIVKSDQMPIVFEIENAQQHRILSPLMKPNYYPVLKENLFTQALVQITLQTGLTDVFNELFSFEGSEMYIYDIPPQFKGEPYSKLYMGLKNASVIGYYDETGNTVLNPSHSYLVKDTDKVIVIMKDDDELILFNQAWMNYDEYVIRREDLFSIENILILGWSDSVPYIIEEISKYVTNDVSITIVDETIKKKRIDALLHTPVNYEIKSSKHYDFDVLSAIDFTTYDRVVIVSCEGYDAEESDTLAISSFIFVKNILSKLQKRPLITLQIEVQKNRDLIESDLFSEFLISDSLISGIISQLSETVKVNDALTQLISADGNEIYFIPLRQILEHIGEEFITVAQAYALGIMIQSQVIGVKYLTSNPGSHDSFEVILNPDKDSERILGRKDELIVIRDF